MKKEEREGREGRKRGREEKEERKRWKGKMEGKEVEDLRSEQYSSSFKNQFAVPCHYIYT